MVVHMLYFEYVIATFIYPFKISPKKEKDEEI